MKKKIKKISFPTFRVECMTRQKKKKNKQVNVVIQNNSENSFRDHWAVKTPHMVS